MKVIVLSSGPSRALSAWGLVWLSVISAQRRATKGAKRSKRTTPAFTLRALQLGPWIGVAGAGRPGPGRRRFRPRWLRRPATSRAVRGRIPRLHQAENQKGVWVQVTMGHRRG